MIREIETLKVTPLFGGRVVLIYLLNPTPDFQGGIAISDPRIEESNGRAFVVGTVPGVLNDWSSGQRVGVAFDQVAHFIAFASEQEFLELSESWNISGVEPN